MIEAMGGGNKAFGLLWFRSAGYSSFNSHGTFRVQGSGPGPSTLDLLALRVSLGEREGSGFKACAAVWGLGLRPLWHFGSRVEGK